MLIIVDYRLPQAAIENLTQLGEVCLFNASGLVPDYLSGHPDIFMTQCNDYLIVAPNTPSYILSKFDSYRLKYQFGKTLVGSNHPNLSAYNAVVTGSFIIHNRKFTDPVLLEYTQSKTFINVNQSFTRCSLISDGEKLFLSSDQDICNKLNNFHYPCLYVDPQKIMLPGLRHGLFGGCCGILDSVVYFSGSLESLEEVTKIKNKLSENGYQPFELYNAALFDGGGIFFLQ